MEYDDRNFNVLFLTHLFLFYFDSFDCVYTLELAIKYSVAQLQLG